MWVQISHIQIEYNILNQMSMWLVDINIGILIIGCDNNLHLIRNLLHISEQVANGMAAVLVLANTMQNGKVLFYLIT